MQLDLPLRGSFFYLEPLNSGTSYGCSYAFRERAGFLSFKLESRVDCEDVLYTLILREHLCNSLAWPSNVSCWPLCLDDIDSSRPAPTRALRASFDDALSTRRRGPELCNLRILHDLAPNFPSYFLADDQFLRKRRCYERSKAVAHDLRGKECRKRRVISLRSLPDLRHHHLKLHNRETSAWLVPKEIEVSCYFVEIVKSNCYFCHAGKYFNFRLRGSWN